MRTIHRLILRLYRIDPRSPLNRSPEVRPDDSPPDSAEMLGCLRDVIAEAETDGGRVDYARLRGSEAYARYRRETARLARFDPAPLPAPERTAFWINLYNAVVIDAVIRFGVGRSVQQVRGFFWRAAYNVGGQRYCANDIEHGILRANGVYPLLPGAHFGRTDPRRRQALAALDARVHFALVCASRSCPPIRAYTPDRVDGQLDMATSAFFRAGARVDPQARRVHLSRIFLWYASDFGGQYLALGNRAGLRRGLARLARPGNPDLADALEDPGYRLSFESYDWGLNGLA